MQREILKRTVCEAVDRQADVIVEVGESIMDDPELGFKEERTAQRVKRIFERANLDFKSELALTGVMASLRSSRTGPTVALMGELDALVVPDHPRAATDTGAAHACGHNAQIAGLMGAALALTEAGVIEHLCGNIVFLAVPAEEYVEIDYRLKLVREGKTSFMAGKPELVHLGVLDDIDMAVMIHSGSVDTIDGCMGVSSSSNGFLAKSVRFVGCASHAGVAPERGINALNAAQLSLAAINAQRETFRDSDCIRVHPILTKGGDLVNIVPSETRLETYVRGRTQEAVIEASAKVDRAFRGAAVSMGCKVEIETVPGYLPLINDSGLTEIFKENAARLFGADSYRDYPHSGGSTDAGDLSQLMPVLHPVMTGAKGSAHASDWHIADRNSGYLAPAKTLAMMAIDLLADEAVNGLRIIQDHRPALTKEAYLQQQKALFRTELFDGGKV